MADTKITVGIDLQDDLTPKINQVKSGLEGIGKIAGEGGGGFIGEQMKELTAGLGYQFGLWNVGFMAAQKLTDAMGELIQDTQIYGQMANRMAGSNENAAASFGSLAAAAIASGTSMSETWKRANELMSVGISQGQAIKEAGGAAIFGREFGQDPSKVIQAINAARMLRMTPEQGITLAAGFPKLRPEAEAALREEAERPYREQGLRHQQMLDQRSFEERTHNTERLTNLDNTRRTQEMEDRQRGENRSMEAAHHRISVETEEQNRAINREMELRHIAANQDLEDRHRVTNEAMEDSHRAISQEMEDRHRLAAQAEQDAQRAYSLRMGGLEAIPGVMDVLAGKRTKTPIGYVAAEALRPEYETGLKEMAKDTGLAISQLREAVREGMSPSTVLQYAQAAREEKMIQERRAMEIESITMERHLTLESITEERTQRLESIKQERGEQKEALDERMRQEDQLHKQQVDFYNEEIAQSQKHEDDRISLEREIQAKQIEHEEDVYNERIRLAHSYEDTLEGMESDRIAHQLEMSEHAIDDWLNYMKTATQRALYQLVASIPGLFGINLPMPGTPAPSGAASQQNGAKDESVQTTNDILSKLSDQLSRVLSGG